MLRVLPDGADSGSPSGRWSGAPEAPDPRQPILGGTFMWWGIGGGLAILWVVLIVTLGVMTLRNGHVVLFILGFFVPFLWILGAVMRPRVATG
jgi:hypothetical protein